MLKQKASSAIRWSAFDQIVQQGLYFAISVVMARLVAPETYGTIALLQFFTSVAAVFVDGGLASALIRKKDATQLEESTVFWFNISVGALMAAGLYLGAPWIARFYDIPVLDPIARIFSLQFVLSALNSVQATLYTKRLDFKTTAKVTAISTIISAAVGIYLAWRGFEIWALVAQTMIAAVIRTGLLWYWSPWRPTFAASFTAFRNFFQYSSYLFFSSLLDVLYLRAYALIIGKIYGVYDLGIYNRADSTRQLPTKVLTGILSRVAFPIFAETADNQERLLRGFRLAIRNVMFVNIPLMIGIAVVADPLIRTLFGEKWVDAIPLLQILSIGAVLWPLHVLNLNVLKALGHSHLFFRVEVIKKCVGLALVIAGAHWGMYGMAWSVVISSVFSFAFNAYYNGRDLQYGSWRQTVDFAPAMACGIVMAIVVLGASQWLHLAPVLQLAALTTIGAVSYLGAAKLFKLEELTEALQFARSTLQKR